MAPVDSRAYQDDATGRRQYERVSDATTWLTGYNLRGVVTSAGRRLTTGGGGDGLRLPDQQWPYGSSPYTQVVCERFLYDGWNPVATFRSAPGTRTSTSAWDLWQGYTWKLDLAGQRSERPAAADGAEGSAGSWPLNPLQPVRPAGRRSGEAKPWQSVGCVRQSRLPGSTSPVRVPP